MVNDESGDAELDDVGGLTLIVAVTVAVIVAVLLAETVEDRVEEIEPVPETVPDEVFDEVTLALADAVVVGERVPVFDGVAVAEDETVTMPEGVGRGVAVPVTEGTELTEAVTEALGLFETEAERDTVPVEDPLGVEVPLVLEEPDTVGSGDGEPEFEVVSDAVACVEAVDEGVPETEARDEGLWDVIAVPLKDALTLADGDLVGTLVRVAVGERDTDVLAVGLGEGDCEAGLEIEAFGVRDTETLAVAVTEALVLRVGGTEAVPDGESVEAPVAEPETVWVGDDAAEREVVTVAVGEPLDEVVLDCVTVAVPLGVTFEVTVELVVGEIEPVGRAEAVPEGVALTDRVGEVD